MLVVGLTGGFGTGKTTAAKMFVSLGAKVLDADKIARGCLRKGNSCFDKVVKAFSEDILRGENIDRKKLAGIVFSDEKARKRLEGIVHPFVIREIKQEVAVFQKKKQKKILVLDVPLLFEAGLDKIVDVVIVVKANRIIQLARVQTAHALTRADACRRMAAQMPISEKIRRTDMLIDNRGSLKETRQQIEKVWNKLKRIQ